MQDKNFLRLFRGFLLWKNFIENRKSNFSIVPRTYAICQKSLHGRTNYSHWTSAGPFETPKTKQLTTIK